MDILFKSDKDHDVFIEPPDVHDLNDEDSRAARSTTTALLPITESIARGFNQQKPPTRTTIMALDFTKAFDTEPHHRLLHRILQSNLATHAVDVVSWVEEKGLLLPAPKLWPSPSSLPISAKNPTSAPTFPSQVPSSLSTGLPGCWASRSTPISPSPPILPT